MNISDKLTQIAENEQKVFAAGQTSEKTRWWNEFQQNGNRQNYRYAFYYGWTDDTYDPTCTIVCSKNSSNNSAAYMFNWSNITDTKVPIIITATSSQNVFASARYLTTIEELTVTEEVTFTNWFGSCANLVDLTMGDGSVIGQNGFNLADSKKLSKDSIKSVVNALSTTTSGLTVTFSQTAVDKAFETSAGAANGTTSAKWAELIALRPNWTITLV